VRERQLVVGVVVAVRGDAQLPDVVLERGAAAGLADFLHGRQQQAYEYGDNGDHHQ
jgi:hypothetical protein